MAEQGQPEVFVVQKTAATRPDTCHQGTASTRRRSRLLLTQLISLHAAPSTATPGVGLMIGR